MRRTPIVALCALVLAVLLIAACGGDPPGRRVIVLGFDGLDYALTRELMAAGRMPSF